jgi:hypothetical protein
MEAWRRPPPGADTEIDMTTTTKALLATALLALGIADAHAQVDGMPYVDAVGAYTQSQIMRHRGDESGKSDKARQQRDARKTTALATRPATSASSRPLPDLTFAPSPRLTTTIHAALVDVLSGRDRAARPKTLGMFAPGIASNPAFRDLLAQQLGADRAQMSKTLQSGVLQRQYGEYLGASGYSAGNVGDVQNAFLVDLWSVANGGAMPDRKRVYGAMRNRLREAYAGNGGPRPPSMDNAQKQETAETVALLGALLNRAWRSADTAADRATLRSGAAALGKRAGMDVRALALTDRGFVTR